MKSETAAIELQKQRAIDTHSSQALEFEESYNELERDAYASCFTYSRMRLAQLLDAQLNTGLKGKKLLDVGCGTGHHLAQLRERGFQVTGVDGSEEMLAVARKDNPGVDFATSDVETLPFADNTFDIAICIEVLRYLPDPRQCIREMARVLRPGGLCLTTATPLWNLNGYYAINRIAAMTHVSGLVPLKQYFTTSWRLRSEFEEAGFKRPEIIGVYFGPVNWVERLAPGRLASFLSSWERIDTSLADKPFFRELSNMFLVRAVKA